MATISAKRSARPEVEGVLKSDHSLPTAARYRLQVDRQMKASFATFEEAETQGKKIKKAHPVVQVSVYDAEEHETKIVLYVSAAERWSRNRKWRKNKLHSR